MLLAASDGYNVEADGRVEHIAGLHRQHCDINTSLRRSSVYDYISWNDH